MISVWFGARSATSGRCLPPQRRASKWSLPQRRPRFFTGRFRALRPFALRPLALRAAAFFLAGLRTAFFAVRFAAFFVDFFAAFLADLRAVFFVDFRADVFAAFFADFRDGDGRARVLPMLRSAAADPLPLRPLPGAPRSGVLAGAENAGAGGTGGGRGSDMGLSSIHPPLVQPVSISSSPDIGAPCSQRGATRRRVLAPRGRGEGVVWI